MGVLKKGCVSDSVLNETKNNKIFYCATLHLRQLETNHLFHLPRLPLLGAR